jgi:GT2 family glycosyltransferase
VVKVSILILNLNGFQFLQDLVTSLYKQTYTDFEVIFVDNGSIDGSADFIKTHYPQIKVIENLQNIGVAKGYNQAYYFSKGDYIVLLNNDTTVNPIWLEELVNIADQDKAIGICQSKILYMDRPNVIYATGHELRLGIIYNRGEGKIDTGQYDTKLNIFGACGCSALYRRNMLEQIGFFDPNYFCYCEDSDLSWRAYNIGWKARYVPSSVCYHKSGGTERNDRDMQMIIERNQLHTIYKNSNNKLLLISFALRELKLMLKSEVGKRLGKNNIGYAPFWNAFKLVPEYFIARGVKG